MAEEKRLHKVLIETERDIYNTEMKYIKDTHAKGNGRQHFIGLIRVLLGNIFKGWDAGATAARPTTTTTLTTGRRAARNPQHEKLFFTLSSLSAPKNDDDLKSKLNIFNTLNYKA